MDSSTSGSRALVFSGGGLKGAAYVGALRALVEAGASFDLFGGSSAGALVATLCGAGRSVGEMEQLLREVSTRPARTLRDYNVRGLLGLLFSLSPRRYRGMIRGDRLERAFRDVLAGYGIRSFRDLKAPTFVVAVNALTGEELVCTNMERCDVAHRCYTSKLSVAAALRASTSIPGVFVPKEMKRGVYIDGGVRSYLPIVTAAQLGASQILGLVFHPGHATRERVLGGGMGSVLGRTLDLLVADQLESDVALLQARGIVPVILQLEVEDPPLFDLARIPELIHAGYAAMKAQITKEPELFAPFIETPEEA